MKLNDRLVVATLSVLAAPLVPASAHAHISMKGALQSRGGDQKMSPCDGQRGDGPTYTFAPGATITLEVNEDIPHPSYFRIAFDDEGEDFVEPASIDPIDPNRACPFDQDDQCGESDYCTMAGSAKGAIVLWDNLDPHLANAAKGGSWNIKLPDVECDSCTLQILQVMEDTVHGAYCPQGTCAASADSLEDIYHRCVDIKLVKGAPAGPGETTAPIDNNGVDCIASAPAQGTAGAGGEGVQTTAAGSGGAAGSTSDAAGAGASAADGGAAAAGASGSGEPPQAGATAVASAGGAGTTASGGTTPVAADSSAAAGMPAPATSSGSSASTGTAASSGMQTAGQSQAGESSTSGPPSDGGGCSTVGGRSHDIAGFGLCLALGAVLARRRRSRRA